MGNALVVMVVPEEMLPTQGLQVRDPKTRKPTKVRPDGTRWASPAQWAKLLREHPDAFWSLDVPRTAVWQLPVEPRAKRTHWYDDPGLVAKHREAVRQSLESFVNEQLAQLDEMVRTGWWILRLGDRLEIRPTEITSKPANGLESETGVHSLLVSRALLTSRRGWCGSSAART